MRARKSAQTAFSSLKVNDADKSSSSVVQAVSAMLNYRGNGLSVKELIDNGGTPKSAIENTLKDSVVLDISGCTVEEILFYVSKGSPVFAMTGTDSAVLVTGYSSGSKRPGTSGFVCRSGKKGAEACGVSGTGHERQRPIL